MLQRDASESVAQLPLHVDARPLGSRARAALAPAEPERSAELELQELQLFGEDGGASRRVGALLLGRDISSEASKAGLTRSSRWRRFARPTWW